MEDRKLKTQQETLEVKKHYDESPLNEWERLKKHPFEFEIAMRYIERYIHAGDSVLDIGGGPGRYSLTLASKGCNVTLADLSDGNIAFARDMAAQHSVHITAFQCNALEIDKKLSGMFDHILLMGPLYHLTQEEDRVRAVEAALRLLKPGGTFFASFISSYGGMVYSLRCDQQQIMLPDLDRAFDLLLHDEPYSGVSFTQSYFIRPHDVLPFMEQFPLKKLHYFGQESILAPFEDKLLAQPTEVIDKWVDFAYAVAENPSFLSYTEHLMYVGRKE